MKFLKELNTCRICGSTDFKTVLKLEKTPLEDQFLLEKRPQSTYPLEVAMCKDCSYTFLLHVIDLDTSYDEYIYESSVTVGLEKHYETYAGEIIEQFGVSKKSLVVDLGSNDGSMLRAFLKKKMRIVGVEPAKQISMYANQQKLKTLNCFFSTDIANKIVREDGQASIITANYMFANIDNLQDFIAGVKVLLKDDGIFVIQTGYHPHQFSKNMFDYIYHEHFSYFTVFTLTYLFKNAGLEIVDAKITEPKGGSIRVIIKNNNNNKKSISLQKIIN